MIADQQVAYVKVGKIVPGINPRTYFDPKEMDELEQSIKVKGIIQPPLLRPLDDGTFQIVAGERRWRAAKKLFGDDYDMPALCKRMTDEEAAEAALIENVQRADMSPAEEAKAAAKILGRCEGDRDEAARRLGWDRKKLDKRLALMNCSDGVLAALSERKIQLGHAELLAAAPKAKQEKVIEKLLAAPSLPSIAQFKAQLEQISLSMVSAIFDKKDCTGCNHNSSVQATMFSEAIADGSCTNAECFNAKTMETLEAKKKELEDEYPSVRIVQPGENFTVIKLVAEGATGVGEEQAKACKACTNYGAAVSNIPGSIGNVYHAQCFDSACNTKKVAERIKAEKAAAQPAAAPAAKTAGKADKKEAGKTTTSKAAPAATSVQDSTRVVDYRIKVWRNVLKRELFADPRENLSMLIGIMMTRGGSNVSSAKLSTAFEKLTGQKTSISDVGVAASQVSNATDEVRSQMLSGIVISMTESIEKTYLPQMLTFLQVDLKAHWKLDAEFLELLTKSEIEVVADELGLKAAMGEKYSKAAGGKKDEFIKALLNVEGFDYTGKVPKVLQYA